MNPLAIAALAAFTACSVGLLIASRRFARRYADLYGHPPRGAWMFRKTDDRELEQVRWFAIVLLPIDLVALAVYFLRP